MKSVTAICALLLFSPGLYAYTLFTAVSGYPPPLNFVYFYGNVTINENDPQNRLTYRWKATVGGALKSLQQPGPPGYFTRTDMTELFRKEPIHGMPSQGFAHYCSKFETTTEISTNGSTNIVNMITAFPITKESCKWWG